jgi:AraC-like DNA-binding protein
MLHKSVVLLLPGVLFLLPLFLHKPDCTLLPSNTKYNLIAYNDEADSSGTSTCAITKATDSVIVFDYTLHKSPLSPGKTPYAGLVIDLPHKEVFLDISRYKYLNVDIVSRQGASFKIHLKTFIPGFTRYGDIRTFHILEALVDVRIGTMRYTIPLNQFQIPEWWDKSVGADKSARLSRTPDFTKFFGLNFQSKSETPLDIPDQFIVSGISFSTLVPGERTRRVMEWVGGFFAYMILAMVALVVLRKRKNGSRNISYQPIGLKNHSDEEYDRLERYLGSHFQEPELTVEQVGRETGITPTRIPLILQQKQKMAFKPYLNKVRLTEAKRLLKETDRTITEIAFAVGYNNIPHFNRVFRQEAGASPTEFRGNRKV